jgi:hypothetical protein
MLDVNNVRPELGQTTAKILIYLRVSVPVARVGQIDQTQRDLLCAVAREIMLMTFGV